MARLSTPHGPQRHDGPTILLACPSGEDAFV
jgi:hypothetical protein